MSEFGKKLEEGAVMVASNASASICSFQAIELKKGQRIFSNSGLAQMGYGLPAAVGASVAAGGRVVYCFEGDGSLQMGLQELETVIYNNLPLKLIVLNNEGYHSIRQTQTNFFGELHGCTKQNGVGFPDLSKLIPAYGYDYYRISTHEDFYIIDEFLAHSAPVVLEVMVTPKQAFAPKASSREMEDGTIQSRPLEDLAPFLPREEYLSNVLIEPIENWKKTKR